MTDGYKTPARPFGSYLRGEKVGAFFTEDEYRADD